MFNRISKIFQQPKLKEHKTDKLSIAVTWKDLAIDPSNVDMNSLLSDWRWIVPENLEPFMVSSMGDMFLRSPKDQIFWLNTCTGKIEQIALNIEEFNNLIKTEEKAIAWFYADLIGEMKACGQILGKNQCYSYVYPPFLGGSYELSNIEITDIYVHFGIIGQIHKQIKDLLPGTKIKIKKG